MSAGSKSVSPYLFRERFIRNVLNTSNNANVDSEIRRRTAVSKVNYGEICSLVGFGACITVHVTDE